MKVSKLIVLIFSLLAILGAIGSLASGESAVAAAVNKKKNEEGKLLQETVRHNKAVEKNVKGLYLRPYVKLMH